MRATTNTADDIRGSAIPIMHYTGMAAASFTPSATPADLSRAVGTSRSRQYP
jgi:NO-binding membrane sensor protein with MHYT domain